MARRTISSSGLVVAAVMVAVAAMLVTGSHGLLTSCDQVSTALVPCFGYLLLGGQVPPGCCIGLRSLLAVVTSTLDRRTACTCILSVASSYTPTIVVRASGLPDLCGVSAPFKISPSTNCTTII